MEIVLAFNYLAIIVAAVASFIAGGVYVNVFSKQWASLNGYTKEQAQKNQKANSKGLIGIFLANLAMAFGLAYFIVSIDIYDVIGAFWLTVWLFIGFVGPLTISSVLWEGKSIKLWIFSNIINVICLFVMALVLAFWR